MIGRVMPGQTFQEFLKAFFADAAARVDHIRDLVEDGDIAELGREVHILSGTSGNIGALEVSRVLAEMKIACEAGDSAQVRRLSGELREASGAASSAIAAWLDEQQAASAA